MIPITNAEIITHFSNGLTKDEIVRETGLNKNTLDSRIKKLKKQSLSKTIPHLVANYLRKKIIE